VTINGVKELAASAAIDGSVHVSELYSGKLVWQASVSSRPTCLAMSPAGSDKAKDVVVGTQRGDLVALRKVCSTRWPDVRRPRVSVMLP
jgi:hypothetical protein